MRKILLSFLTAFALLGASVAKAQCDLQFNNLVITPAGDPVVLTATKCQYTFNASFDITTNSGFKYLFFHSWLSTDYPSPPIFDCSGNTPAVDPGTAAYKLGMAVDEPGKSFLDFGFIGLKDFLAVNPATSPTDITTLIATTYIHDNTVVLTQPSNSPGLNAKVTKTGNILHFDISNIRIAVNIPCNSPINVKTDIWGSNSNGADPKAQCYICGISQSFNFSQVALQKFCNVSPFQYEIGITTLSPTDIHVVYKLYADDLDGIKEPGTQDPLIFTSITYTINASTPFSSGHLNLPNPFCCIEPWAHWGIFAEVTATEFSNSLGTPVIEEACAVLPVNLKSFTAIRDNDLIKLKWETAQEQNSKGFAVMRLIANGNWQIVGFVDTKAVNGSSNSSLTYEFTDINTTDGITQYRLKQLDVDGKQTYSQIRAVRGKGQKTKTIIYPNPSNDGNVNVVFEERDAIRDVSLMDVNGRMIKQWKNIRNNTLQIENLYTGFYSLRIVNTETGEQAVEKIVVKNR